MKTTFLACAGAIAVAFSLAPPAQAAGSVQLYGTIDLGLTHFTGLAPSGGGSPGQTVSSTGISSGAQSASRIGVSGTESLGDGLLVLFRAESGFCAAGTNQSGAVATGFAGRSQASSSGWCSGDGFMGRQAYVGLAGSFGTLLAGRLMNLAYLNEKAADPFQAGMTGNYNNINTEASGAALETNQVLAYVSPDFHGFNTTLGYAFNVLPSGYIVPGTTQEQNAVKTWVAGVNYKSGRAFAAVDYQLLSDFDAQPGGSGLQTGSLNLYQISGGYDFGAVKLSALYGHMTMDYYSGNNTSYLLGATIPAGPGAVLASYDVSKYGLGDPAAPRARQYAVGYTYSLSKQTNLYASFAHISNDTGSTRAVGDATDGFTGVSGQGSNGMAIGIRHNF